MAKRIQSACLLQTIHFLLKDDIGHAAAANAVRDEVKHYKANLDRDRVKYKIEEETVQPDDSVIIKIRKQYTIYNPGDYLD